LLYHVKERKDEKAVVKVRDLASGKEQECLDSQEYSRGALSADGKLGAVVDGFTDEIVLFNTEDGKKLHRFAGRALPSYGVGWAPEGNEISFGSDPGKQPSDRFQARTPLHRAFSLEKMGFVPRQPPDRYLRAILQRDDQSLEEGPGRRSLV